MKCARCGSDLAGGLAACPKCGMPMGAPNPAQSVAMPAGAAALSQAYDAQRRRNAITTSLVIALFLLAMGLIAVTKGLQALGFGQRQADAGALAVKGQVPDTNILGAIGNQPAPILQQSATAPAAMPQDVYDWLEHLRKTEEARVALTTTQLGKAMTEYTKQQVFGGVDSLKDLLNGIDDPSSELKPPTAGLTKVIKELHDQSRDLIEKFESKQPPPECVPIHDSYYKALSETTGMLGDLSDHLAANDLDALMKMKGTSGEGIDTNAIKTDRLLGEICDKYNTRRWFSIKGDIGTDSFMGMPKL
jgi:hypothetical protein